MAANLNQNRILLSQFIAVGAFVLITFSAPFFGEANPLHVPLKMLGILLISICVMGRIYSTAYLGGNKNERLITDGIYSIMRNPLYFFSLIGVSGISIFTGHLAIMLIVPTSFLLIYIPLIKREEAFLTEQFGQEYINYKNRVRALIPNFQSYNEPHSLEISPKYLKKSIYDAFWWVVAIPIIETLQWLQESGLLLHAF